MNYLLSASLVLLLAWPACHLLLRYTNRYVLNRWLLLFAFGVIALLPMIPLQSPAPTATEVVSGTIEGVITDFVVPTNVANTSTVQPSVAPLPAAAASTATPLAPSSYFSWYNVYLAGLAFFLLVLVVRLAFLLAMHLRSRPNGDARYQILHPGAKAGQAFTFGRKVYFSIDVPDGPDFEHILAHEKIHAQQGHSIDILISELFLCVFWFHPVAWWLRNKLRANLEYLVDNEVVNQGASRRDYQLALVRQSQIAHNLALALPFSEPTLKGRIARMTGLPQHRVIALLATIAMLFWVGVAGMVVYGTTPPVYTGEEPFVAYYKDKVPEQILSLNIYAKRAPTTDEYYQLRAILKHIPETQLYLYKNPFDDGLTMRLAHWQNEPVTLNWLPEEASEDRIYRMGLMPRIAPFANLTAPLPTGGYFVPVTEDNDSRNLFDPIPESTTFIIHSYGYEPSGLDLQHFEFAPGEEFVVTINGRRFPLRPAEVISAKKDDGKLFLFDNGTVAPTKWSINEYFAPYQLPSNSRIKNMLGCKGTQNCPRTSTSIYNPSIEQATAWVAKYKPLDNINVRAYYNDQHTSLEELLSREYGPNSMLQVGYRTDDKMMSNGYVVQVIDDSPAQVARAFREMGPSQE